MASPCRGYEVLWIEHHHPGVEAQIPVRALHLGEIDPYRDLFEIVFLTAKSYDTVWIVHFIKPHLKPDGVLVSIQNSLNDEWIAPIIGYEREVASVIELSAEMYEPGRIKRNTDHSRTWFALGELHGRFTPAWKKSLRSSAQSDKLN